MAADELITRIEREGEPLRFFLPGARQHFLDLISATNEPLSAP